MAGWTPRHAGAKKDAAGGPVASGACAPAGGGDGGGGDRRPRGLADRIECRHGDYHADEYEPGAYDACTIFGALHQESPEDIVAILGRAFRALKPGGVLYVLDMMTDATRANPPFSALFGLNMALTTKNGWVFSDDELKGWMREAGFEPGATRPAPPPMPHWLVAAVRP